MSTTVDYFFNSDKDLHELSREINESLGCGLSISRPHDKEQAWCHFFGMSLDFYEHSLESDGRVELDRFKYEIGFAGPSVFGSMQVSIMAMIAYLLYVRLGISDGLLVFDVQIPLARYERRVLGDGIEDLFDKISGKVVEFPQHLADIDSLIRWQL